MADNTFISMTEMLAPKIKSLKSSYINPSKAIFIIRKTCYHIENEKLNSL